MKPINAKRERGAALLALLAVIMLGASWLLVSQLNAESGGRSAAIKARNAAVLNQAKQALIGYVAAQAVKAGENNPGAMPCPENPGDFDSTTGRQGLIGTTCGTTTIGRFPWRTLGLDQLVDASGEPLWYVVGPGWGVATGANTVINSNSLGMLSVDGVNNDAIALIIAPGPAFAVPAAANCAAWNQVRPATGIPDWRNYLECENATSPADATFVARGPSGSFNDQVLRITVADIVPAIEAAIADRIKREIVPVLTAYANPTWGTFPFPALFGDPTISPYLGQAGSPYQGLLPFNYHSGSCPVGDARCSISTITWGTPSMSSSGGPGYLTTPTSSPSSPLPNCTVSGSMPMCEGYYYGGALNISMTDALTTQIADGLRTFTLASHSGTVQALRWTGAAWVDLGTQSATVSRSLASDGSARFVAGASLPSVPTWGYYYVRGSRPTISDHSILSSTDPTTGWFVRNEWYRLLYYAIAQGYAPGGSLSCISGGSGSTGCLQVTNLTDPTKQRAVLALAGRSLSALSQTRPSGNLQNYLDSAENRNEDSIFVQSPVNRSFNDRFISISKNP